MALCECGYTANGYGDDKPWLFTDMLESRFIKTNSMSPLQDWLSQEYNVSAQDGRGKYGKEFISSNILTHPQDPATEGFNQSSAGVELRVKSNVRDGAVLAAEMDTSRRDLHWGSYRAGMKLTKVSGTCAAFFWVCDLYGAKIRGRLTSGVSSTSTTRKRSTWNFCLESSTETSKYIQSIW